MSNNVYTRLRSLFPSSKNASSSIKSNLKQQIQKENIDINKEIKELFNETDSQKLVEKFNSLSKHRYFRSKYRVYNHIIHRLTLSKQFSVIEDVIESQKKYISGEGFASRLIYLYGKSGLFENAHKLFDEMPQLGCQRKEKSFTVLLGAASNSGRYDKVYELFRELPGKLSIGLSVDSYNAAGYALCKLGLIDDAVLLVDEMEGNGLKPSVCLLNTLVGAFYDKGEFEKGEEVWDRMVGKGVVPNMISYNFKLKRFSSEGKVLEAMELIDELKYKGLNPDVGSYNALILGSCKGDDLDGVRRWYTELMNCGCVPNKTTFYIIVPFLCDKGDYSLAFEVCKRMFRHQCSVDESVLQKVVDGLAKNSMIDEAKILVGLGKSNSFFPYDLVLPSQGVMSYLR